MWRIHLNKRSTFSFVGFLNQSRKLFLASTSETKPIVDFHSEIELADDISLRKERPRNSGTMLEEDPNRRQIQKSPFERTSSRPKLNSFSFLIYRSVVRLQRRKSTDVFFFSATRKSSRSISSFGRWFWATCLIWKASTSSRTNSIDRSSICRFIFTRSDREIRSWSRRTAQFSVTGRSKSGVSSTISVSVAFSFSVWFSFGKIRESSASENFWRIFFSNKSTTNRIRSTPMFLPSRFPFLCNVVFDFRFRSLEFEENSANSSTFLFRTRRNISSWETSSSANRPNWPSSIAEWVPFSDSNSSRNSAKTVSLWPLSSLFREKRRASLVWSCLISRRNWSSVVLSTQKSRTSLCFCWNKVPENSTGTSFWLCPKRIDSPWKSSSKNLFNVPMFCSEFIEAKTFFSERTSNGFGRSPTTGFHYCELSLFSTIKFPGTTISFSPIDRNETNTVSPTIYFSRSKKTDATSRKFSFRSSSLCSIIEKESFHCATCSSKTRNRFPRFCRASKTSLDEKREEARFLIGFCWCSMENFVFLSCFFSLRRKTRRRKRGNRGR